MADLPTNETAIDRDQSAATDDSTSKPATPVSPVPPRFWWLKRILVVSGVLLILLLGVRLWWGWEAHRQLQAEIDRIIAAGEPIYPADFDPPPMRPEENAAELYLDAEAAVNITPSQNELVINVFREYSEIRKRVDEVEQFVRANAKAFQLVRRASGLEKVDWGNRIRSPTFNFLVPNLSVHRLMSKLLSIAAIYHSERANDVEALTTLFDALRFTESVDREPFLITHLVAMSFRSLVVHDIENVTPTITLDAIERDPDSANRPHELVSLLIAELLDERSCQLALVRAIQSDRMVILDSTKTVLRGDAGIGSLTSWGPVAPPTSWERALGFPLTPMLEHGALEGVRFCSAFVDGAGKPNWTTARDTFPPEPSDWSPLERLTRPIAVFILSSLDRVVFLHFRALAESRMAAIALAIRLYEVDHDRRPDALAELVPAYLSAVPLDPLAADDQPIGYLPHALKPLLYSVGKNGTDDGGSYTVHSNGGFDRRSLDHPFFLNGDRPTRKRESDDTADDSGETDDDHDDVERDGGESDEDEPGEREP